MWLLHQSHHIYPLSYYKLIQYKRSLHHLMVVHLLQVWTSWRKLCKLCMSEQLAIQPATEAERQASLAFIPGYPRCPQVTMATGGRTLWTLNDLVGTLWPGEDAMTWWGLHHSWADLIGKYPAWGHPTCVKQSHMGSLANHVQVGYRGTRAMIASHLYGRQNVPITALSNYYEIINYDKHGLPMWLLTE